MIIEQVNTLALVRAAEAIVGPQVTAGISTLYQIIDRAMKDGYEMGTIDATEGVEERLDAAFDCGWRTGKADIRDAYDEAFGTGYDAGVLDGILEASGPEGRAYDEGYLDGVQDARARPAVADGNVVDIINLLSSEAFNGEFDICGHTFDINLARDSGDEA